MGFGYHHYERVLQPVWGGEVEDGSLERITVFWSWLSGSLSYSPVKMFIPLRFVATFFPSCPISMIFQLLDLVSSTPSCLDRLAEHSAGSLHNGI